MSLNVTVGQEVAVIGTGGRNLRATFSTVAKINGYGHIFLNDGSKFDKHGVEYDHRDSRYAKRLNEKVAEIRSKLEQQQAFNKNQQQIRAVVDQANQLLYANRNGYNEYFISAKTKAELLAMIESIPVTEV